jgi:hypothetical protein
VLTNKVLDAVAAAGPHTGDALLRVCGIGPKKMAEFGNEILEITTHSVSPSSPLETGNRAADRPVTSTITSSAPHTAFGHVGGSQWGAGEGVGDADDVEAFLAHELERQSLRRAGQTSSARQWISEDDLTDEQLAAATKVLSGQNVFLTGAAGTGKSFLFGYLVQELTKKHGEGTIAVTAPTGVAAINVNGTTIHSFAGVGLGRGSLNAVETRVRKSKRAVHNWRNTAVLLIDEVSMLDGQLFTKLVG